MFLSSNFSNSDPTKGTAPSRKTAPVFFALISAVFIGSEDIFVVPSSAAMRLNLHPLPR